jgi:glycosyltransferase involved in cell wall biosynthesis
VVEIVVSNNASDDGTREYLGSLSGMSGLVIHHNDKNNCTRNFHTVCQHANGMYCWLMGDDDQPNPGAIVRMLDQLYVQPDWVFGDLSIEHADRTRTFVQVYKGSGTSWEIGLGSHFANWANSLTSLAGAGGLLSNLIGRRELLLDGFEATQDWGVDTLFPHVAAFLHASATSGRVAAIREPIVLFRDYNDTGGQTDPWTRIMIDLRAWVKFGEMQVVGSPRMTDIERAAWYGVLRRHHGLKPMRTLSTFRDEAHPWEEARSLLLKVGYRKEHVALAGAMPQRYRIKK